MQPPLTSVVALARFELEGDHLIHAQRLLKQERDWQTWIDQIELHGLSQANDRHGFIVTHRRIG